MPASSASPSFASVDEALRWLAQTTQLDPATEPAVLVRRARALHHPDRTGGDRTGWDRVDAAEQLLTTTTRR